MPRDYRTTNVATSAASRTSGSLDEEVLVTEMDVSEYSSTFLPQLVPQKVKFSDQILSDNDRLFFNDNDKVTPSIFIRKSFHFSLLELPTACTAPGATRAPAKTPTRC